MSVTASFVLRQAWPSPPLQYLALRPKMLITGQGRRRGVGAGAGVGGLLGGAADVGRLITSPMRGGSLSLLSSWTTYHTSTTRSSVGLPSQLMIRTQGPVQFATLRSPIGGRGGLPFEPAERLITVYH